jgi:hypothetical protein
MCTRKKVIGLWLKIVLAVFPLLTFTGCFEFIQIISWQKNDTLDVRYYLRYPLIIEQMQSSPGQEGMEDDWNSKIAEAKKYITDSIKAQVKNFKVKQSNTEYEACLEMSFQIPSFSRMSADKERDQNHPFIPIYDAVKKQVVFTFDPMNALKNAMPPAGASEAPSDSDENALPPDSSADTETTAKIHTQESIRAMFALIRYQIFVGDRLAPQRVILRSSGKEMEVALIHIGSLTMIDLPFSALFSANNELTSVILSLK